MPHKGNDSAVNSHSTTLETENGGLYFTKDFRISQEKMRDELLKDRKT